MTYKWSPQIWDMGPRAQAFRGGYVRFYRNEPCKRCNGTQRFVSNNSCCLCKKEKDHTRTYRRNGTEYMKLYDGGGCSQKENEKFLIALKEEVKK